jgi:hypothetical protein
MPDDNNNIINLDDRRMHNLVQYVFAKEGLADSFRSSLVDHINSFWKQHPDFTRDDIRRTLAIVMVLIDLGSDDGKV